VGGGVAAAIFGASDIFESSGRVFVTLLLEIAAAAAIVGVYRRSVQRRPLAGADARRFPTRGVGVGRMRERLRALGIDPDRLARGGTASRPADRSADDAEELARPVISVRRASSPTRNMSASASGCGVTEAA
jgi:hypothetical protein